MSPTIVNVAAYKFVELDRLAERRRELRDLTKRLQLKGTILLAAEGINLFVAGSRAAIDEFLSQLRAEPCFADLQVKESLSDEQPFNRMLVRIKKEIIACGDDGIVPAEHTSAKIGPQQLKQWLDDGKELTLLDVRNDYEVKLGTFQSALPIGIDHFRDFPDATSTLPAELQERPVVMFCTGGIRCEKAGPLLERAGFRDVMQLEGGILKYFEECGGEHYDGECFVFDQRVALDSDLCETPTTQCYACQEPLTAEDQQSPQYVPPTSCPHCYREPEEELAATLRQRHEQIANVMTPLPGSVPYDNVRPMNVPLRFDRYTLLDFLAAFHPHVSRDQWREVCESGRLVQDDAPVALDRIVRAGERYERLLPGTIEPDVNTAIRILHEDDAIIVVDKPAPLPMHPCGRFNRNTLTYLLNEVYHPQKPRPVHRLDANTSGIIVFGRTRHVAAKLQPQFASGAVEKRYVARIHGTPADDAFTCDAAISEQPTTAGLRVIDPQGLPAQTEFTVLERFPDGTSLVEARPVTGRTNQIRLHLWHLGYPICGDLSYLPNQQLAGQQTLTPADAPMLLRATSITFSHPISGDVVTYAAMPLPAEFRAVSSKP